MLEGLDLDVASGELMAILGPSGCGKTTLLRLIAGFAHADAGTITLGDHLVSGPGRHIPATRRHVGYVAQEGALFPHLDVARNITFGLPRGERRQRARLHELLELVGLDASYAGRRPDELSGGQQQRVAVARALAPGPSMVLLDEPFASLDASLRQGTGRAVTDALRAAGATAVLVTHDQSEALSLADRVAVMHDGRIVQTGSPQHVYERPADPTVAAFVGGSVLLRARLEDGVATCALGELPVAGRPYEAAATDSVDVLIRPEQLELKSALDDDGVPAQVLSVSYFGHDADVRLQLAGAGMAIVARTHGSYIAKPGDRVRVAVSGSVLAFPGLDG